MSVAFANFCAPVPAVDVRFTREKVGDQSDEVAGAHTEEHLHHEHDIEALLEHVNAVVLEGRGLLLLLTATLLLFDVVAGITTLSSAAV